MKILVTGGAGYIGSTLVRELLRRGDNVTVLDNLSFGGEALLPFVDLDTFSLVKQDLCVDGNLGSILSDVDCVVHLAALVGFPACERAGRTTVWRVNVDATKRIYQAAERAGVPRLIFASSCSNYGETEESVLATEESQLHPKSSYAESKIEAEQFLLRQVGSGATQTVCLRFATAFGLSPRMRFDLIVNQFALEAYSKGRIILLRENFKRVFIHVRDAAMAILHVMTMPIEKIQNQVFNIGSASLNTSKHELAQLILNYVPDLRVEYSGASFEGDTRNIHVSFEKMREQLRFEPKTSLEQGIEELIWSLGHGIFQDPFSEKWRNHPALVL